MHLKEAAVSSPIPTEVLECGGELNSEETTGLTELESEIEEIAAEED
jgi:hypothetical protein